MKPTNPQLARLTAEERVSYDHIADMVADGLGDDTILSDTVNVAIQSLIRLSACRASEDRKRKLLKKHEVFWNEENSCFTCAECAADTCGQQEDWLKIKMRHAPNCAWDAELAGKGE